MTTSIRFYIVAVATLLAWSFDELAASVRRGLRAERIVVLALAVAAGAIGSAQATTLSYDFQFTGAGVSGAGTLTTSGTADAAAPYGGGYDILGVVGAINGDPIVSVSGNAGPALLSLDGFFIYDDIFYPAGTVSQAGGFFDVDGLLFATPVNEYNLYNDGGSYVDYAYSGQGIVVSFTASREGAVPEPAALGLFSAALFGTWMLRRKPA